MKSDTQNLIMKNSEIKCDTAVNGSTESLLKRSFSLPLSRLKSRKDGYTGVKAYTNGTASKTVDKREDNAHAKPSSHVSRFKRGIFSSRSMRGQLGRTKDIRISRFDVSEVPVTNDVKDQVKKAENQRKKNGFAVHKVPNNSHKTCHETIMEEPNSHSEETVGDSQRRMQAKTHNKRNRWHSKNTLVRALGGSLKRSKEKRNGIILKTVEIHRSNDLMLGIYIKQIKRTSKNSNSSKSPQNGVIISRLVPGSSAAEHGTLKPGDEIVSINDVDIDSMDIKMVAAIMDLPKVLLLVVKSRGSNYGLNNNLGENGYVGNTLIKKDSNDVDEGFQDSVIPSVYDNDIAGENNIILNNYSEKDKNIPLKPKIKIEFDEAYQSLMNAITDLEQLTSAPQSYDVINEEQETEASRPSSYWDVLNDWIRPSDIGKSKSITSSKSEPNDNDLQWEESILHQIPHFPTASFLSVNEDPDYDEVASSVFGEEGDELQVEGFAKHLSQLPSRLSSSNDSMTSNASTGLYPVQHMSNKAKRLPSYKKPTGVKLKKSFSAETYSSTKSERFSESDSGSVNKTMITHPHTEQMGRKNSGVTVAKRQEWFNSGQKVSRELQQRIVGTSLSQKTNQDVIDGSIQKDLSKENIRSSSESSNMSASVSLEKKLSLSVENTAASNTTVTPSDIPCKNEVKIAITEEVIVPKNRQGSSQKGLKVFLPSPTRSRKKKFRKKLRNLTKRSGSESTSPDQISPPSPCLCVNQTGTIGQYEKLGVGGINQTANIINRYHLDLAQQRRLSRQFILDQKNNHHPFAKPINFSEFKKYKPQNDAKSDADPIQGSLVLTLYGATALKKTVSGVYCVAQVDDAVTNRIRTSIGGCRSSVAWNECFELKLEEAYSLHLTLYSWERKGQHKPLAKATIPICNLLNKKKQGEAHRLAIKLDPRGTLYIKLSLEDPATLAGPQVFGADLQSVLDREKSGLHIPLLVEKCIREVESRGMQIVGIYRLCGSAIMKKDLRRKFEEDAESVDLSPEKYPDVNVITGILKDFLRELPQPLFPPELLETVTASMESSGMFIISTAQQHDHSTPALLNNGNANTPQLSSPFDPTPAVNHEPAKTTTPASDALNLLEDTDKLHLPPAERSTLYALLNHLKKVASNQSTNKMTCQNLAVCFGPVLLGSVHMGQSKNAHDLAAAIGFKRHIQVLNYMVTNWPDAKVPLSPLKIEPDYDEIAFDDYDLDDNVRASRRTSRVSLTRRISHAFPSIAASSSGNLLDVHEGENEEDQVMATESNFIGLERSSSLTSIDESHVAKGDITFHPTDEFFVQDVEDLFNGESDEEHNKENIEQQTSYLKYASDGTILLNI